MPSTFSTSSPQEMVSHVSPDLEMEERQATEDIVSLSSEERERKIFMGDINKFMAEIGKPLSKIPIMGYKELDLYQLFKEVTAYGGFIEVVKNVGTWSKIWKRLGNFDPSITDSSFRLKKNYERYLLEYEYKCFPEHKQQALEMEKQLLLKKSQRTGEQSPPSPSSPIDTLILPVAKKAKTSELMGKSKAKKTKKAFSNYRDIGRDKSGVPKMPLSLGELTVECVGEIVPRSPYITEKHIWPVGFRSFRYFSSMRNPDQKVKYTSQIIDGGDKPQFMVTAEDDPDNPLISYSPSGVWRTVLKKVMTRSQTEEPRNISVSGTLRFGLAHPIVSHLIRELPNADLCKENGDSWSSSPSNSPSLGRKRRTMSDDSETEEKEESSKRPKRAALEDDEDYAVEEYESNLRGTSRTELEDLVQNAVVTLQALKYCAVY